MSAKKTAFSDVKNLMNTNTPKVPLKGNVSGLKKPVFGLNFKANNVAKTNPIEAAAAPQQTTRLLQSRNYKPRIDLSSIDYSENEPHGGCHSSTKNQSNDIMFDFWSATNSKFEIYCEEPLKPVEIPEMPEIAPLSCDIPEALPDRSLFDDLPIPSFSGISFDDF